VGYERNVRKLEQMLRADGFTKENDRHTTSHAKWTKGEKMISVPRSKEINSWAIRKIYKDAGWL